MHFFEKPLDQLTREDIGWLIETEAREGQTFELKSALSADKGTIEPWTSGENKIGRTAVAALVRELISFANSQGGILVLGVAEGGERPARATAITPVRAAIQLAERLKRTCPDNFDPPVYGFEIVGIEMEDDGSGVVVMRIPASPYGPHRSRADKECYVRRNDEAMAIGMDEIQRRVVEMSRRRQAMDAKFEAAKITASELPPMSGIPCWRMRAVAVPIGDFFLPRIFRHTSARPQLVDIPVKTKRGNSYKTAFIVNGIEWRPIVQGMEGRRQSPNWPATLRLGSDGSMSFDWSRSYDREPYLLYIGYFTGIFANVLLAIERMRLAAKLPYAEFAVELSLGVVGAGLGEGMGLGEYASSVYGWSDFGGTFPRGVMSLARYPVAERSGFDELTRAVEMDAYHLAGIDPPEEHSFDFTSALAGIDREF